MSSFFTTDEEDREALEQEARESLEIEESLIQRAYAGRSRYKLVTVETRLIILLA
jgi:hypothetical protein